MLGFFKDNRLLLTLFIICVFMNLNCICASDLSDGGSGFGCDVGASTFVDLSNDFAQLSSGDTYTLEHDFYYNDTCDNAFINGVPITVDNVTIDGNYHTVDGMNVSGIFKVYGDDVKIFNLNIVNSNAVRYYDPVSSGSCGLTQAENVPFDQSSVNVDLDYVNKLSDFKISPVTWYGDNGVISNCNFMFNTAVNGGAVSWRGNNGVISDVDFVGNRAKGIGGSLHVLGVNNTIVNSNFMDSFSDMSGEAIYLGYKSNNTSIGSCDFSAEGNTGEYSVIDGSMMALDSDYFYGTVMYEIYSGKSVDLIKYAYLSCLYSNKSLIFENGTYACNSEYKNNVFKLNFNKIYRNYDIIYDKFRDKKSGIDVAGYYPALVGDFVHIKTFAIENVTCLNDVFNYFYSNAGEYDVEDVLLANYTLKGNNLGLLNKLSFKPEVFDIPYDAKYLEHLYIKDGNRLLGNYVRQYGNGNLPSLYEQLADFGIKITTVLNINLEAGQSAVFTKQLHLPKEYTVVNINGNGFKVSACSGKANLRSENHLLVLDRPITFFFSNLTIEKYNTAIRINDGICVFNNVVFNNNKLNYRIDKGFGGAIYNAGVCICNNCTFTNNYANYGGAIFNVGVLIFDNYTFFDHNDAKKKGSHILNVDSGKVFYNGEEVQGDKGKVRYESSLSSVDKGIIAVGSFVSSFAIGFLVSACCVPVVAVVAGVVAGAVLGCIATYIIDQGSYDLHFNRLKWGLICIGGSIAAGLIGVYAGTFVVVTLGV